MAALRRRRRSGLVFLSPDCSVIFSPSAFSGSSLQQVVSRVVQSADLDGFLSTQVIRSRGVASRYFIGNIVVIPDCKTQTLMP
ncbi:hypothetical protein EJB05_26233 [Eragrostis curvula]|uniref:Uncharacterized protein n=1 Tax=Eragrostis curvula TaxID=38414 RepID=A0A5J9UL12_9POAL|nr:hypothetical protein EJB05_26233 [Eragrostis curvula]